MTRHDRFLASLVTRHDRFLASLRAVYRPDALLQAALRFDFSVGAYPGATTTSASAACDPQQISSVTRPGNGHWRSRLSALLHKAARHRTVAIGKDETHSSQFRFARTTMAKAHGASRLELLIVVVLIGIVVTVLLERLTRYQELAEKTAMEATIVNLRSGLRIRVAEMMIGGRMGQLAVVQHENPITWLVAPPANYGGQLSRTNGRKPQPGTWYFDIAQQQLVYFPQHHRFFQPATSAGPIEVRLQLMARTPAAGLTLNPVGPVEGLSLVLQPYRWNQPI